MVVSFLASMSASINPCQNAGSATLASLLLHQHSKSPAAAVSAATVAVDGTASASSTPAAVPHVPGTRTRYVPGQLLQRTEAGPSSSAAAAASNYGTGAMGGGPSASSTVNFQAAISAAYLSYAAVMVQWRQLTRQNGALLRADTLGMQACLWLSIADYFRIVCNLRYALISVNFSILLFHLRFCRECLPCLTIDRPHRQYWPTHWRVAAAPR
jgi:hypothetical protein